MRLPLRHARRLAVAMAFAAVGPMVLGSGVPSAGVLAAAPLAGAGPVAAPEVNAALTQGSAGSDQTLLRLVSQAVTPNGTFTFSVLATAIPAPSGSETDDVEAQELEVVATLHPRLRSRSQLDATVSGNGLGSTLAITRAQPLTANERAARFATRTLTFSFGTPGPECPACVVLPFDGVHPVRVELRTVSGDRVLDAFTTWFTRVDPAVRNPFEVAIVVPVHLPTRLRGEAQPDSRSVIAMIESLASRPFTPLTIAATPATLDALSEASDTETDVLGPDGPLVELLRSVIGDREVLSSTYVRWDRSLLAQPALQPLVAAQRRLGAEVVRDRLGVGPVADIAILGDEVPPESVLESLGAQRLVVSEAALAREGKTVDPTRPVLIDPGARSGNPTAALPAVVMDRSIQERLEPQDTDRPDGADDVTRAQQVLADLALVALNVDHSSARGFAVVVPDTTPQETVAQLLDGLAGSPGLYQAVTLSQLFSIGLQDDGDSPLVRAPAPLTASATQDRAALSVARLIVDQREALDGYRSLFAPADDSTDTTDTTDTTDPVTAFAVLERRLAQLSADDLGSKRRSLAITALDDGLRDAIGVVGITPSPGITLTAREQSVPIPLVNNSGRPVDVVLVVESDNATLVGGVRQPLAPGRQTITVPMRLGRRVQVVKIPVRTRGPGRFSLVMRLETGDGFVVSRARYRLRSTEMGPIGIVLSVGSLIVLAVWWLRTATIRRRRALRRHPANGRPGAGHDEPHATTAVHELEEQR